MGQWERVLGGAGTPNGHHPHAGSPHLPPALLNSSERFVIRDVWQHNLEEEFKRIRLIVQKYPYIAMDTEFPGVVAKPVGEFRSNADYLYQLVRCNVDLLKIIQLGLTFMDENGSLPPGVSTWQFNFKFSVSEDMFAQDSIDLLASSGLQFRKHDDEGIDPYEFAQLLITSGVVLCEPVRWLSFHAGYDFGYLLKLLTAQPLPEEPSEFFELLRIYFPTIYDIKYLMKSCKDLKGGLQEVAAHLDLERIGSQHQAGSDSLLTGHAFFKMREMFFEDNIDDAKYSGQLYGLAVSNPANALPPAPTPTSHAASHEGSSEPSGNNNSTNNNSASNNNSSASVASTTTTSSSSSTVTSSAASSATTTTAPS